MEEQQEVLGGPFENNNNDDEDADENTAKSDHSDSSNDLIYLVGPAPRHDEASAGNYNTPYYYPRHVFRANIVWPNAPMCNPQTESDDSD
jgi:hypothetical protein